MAIQGHEHDRKGLQMEKQPVQQEPSFGGHNTPSVSPMVKTPEPADIPTLPANQVATTIAMQVKLKRARRAGMNAGKANATLS
jgi:hypothetical protein